MKTLNRSEIQQVSGGYGEVSFLTSYLMGSKDHDSWYSGFAAFAVGTAVGQIVSAPLYNSAFKAGSWRVLGVQFLSSVAGYFCSVYAGLDNFTKGSK